MIELYVLVTLSAMGYLLNKSSTTVNTKNNMINVNELPSQDSIYSSNRAEQVRKIEERKVAKMWAKSQNPTHTNVISKNYAALNEYEKPKVQQVRSLTGEFVNADSLTHNNMVPFFGGNVKQNMSDTQNKSILENYTGVSEVFKNKAEVPCLYDKAKDFGNVNGMQNQDDFYRERMVESRNKNNVVPIPQIRVGPGLNQGYDANPTGGYQQLDAQNIAMSYYKDVDDLRVATNPKQTFEGRTIDGKKGDKRAEVPNLAKNRVETFFQQTPDMLFKTTGAFTKPTEIPEFNVKVTNRLETTREEIGIAGNSGAVFKRTLDEENVKPSTRQQLKEFGVRNTALNKYGKGNKDDYGKSKILVYNNERDITTTRVYQGNVTSLIKAIVAPLQDALRINKKEVAVDNPRHFGNMNIQVPGKQTMYDPNDTARTTLKETLIHDEMGLGSITGPKKLTIYDPNDTARTTIKETQIHDEMGTGTIAGPKKLIVYDPDEIAKRTVRETLDRMDYEMNLGTSVSKGVTYDPNDTTRTTMKETLVELTHDANINALEGMGNYINDYLAKNTQKQFISDKDYIGTAAREMGEGYITNKYEAPNTQKQFVSDKDYIGVATRGKGEGYTTNKHEAPNTQKQFLSDMDYYGVSGSAFNKKSMSKKDMENAVITARKEVLLHGREPTYEGKKVANGGESVNVDVRRIECDIAANRATNNATRVVSQIPDLSLLNLTKDRAMQQTPDDRLDPSLLQALNSNPYSQSINSAF